jgi:hypothetical protein
MRKVRYVWALLLPVIALTSIARADAPASSTSEPGLFSKGIWALELSGGYAAEFYPYDHEKITTGLLGVHYYFVENISVGLQLPGYGFQQIGPDAHAFGLNLAFRDHFLHAGPSTLFVDLAGGISQADHTVPPTGTYFNFTLQGGLGATYRIAEHVDLMLGVHLFHLSNAAIRGINRNPDLNAAQGYAGVLFTF